MVGYRNPVRLFILILVASLAVFSLWSIFDVADRHAGSILSFRSVSDNLYSDKDVSCGGGKVDGKKETGEVTVLIPENGPGSLSELKGSYFKESGEISLPEQRAAERDSQLKSEIEKEIDAVNLLIMFANERETQDIFFVEKINPDIARELSTTAIRILAGAKLTALKHSVYTPGYFKIPYPMGDLPPGEGVCTDVIIRALRHAGMDLQTLVHEDMKKNFSLYPRKWGLSKPDPNIDHRRVPNLMKFFSRHWKELDKNGENYASWRPGDIVFWKFENGLDHCGIISDRITPEGRRYVIHNCWRTVEEDCLLSWRIIGHFRYPE